MPKKPNAHVVGTDNYLVTYTVNSIPHWTEYVGFKNALEGYRWYRQIYGDNVRLAQVVFNYGTEV